LFKTNDVVVYGAEGVFKIAGLENKTISGTDKMYYVLKPINSKNSTVYVPGDNKQLLSKMRNTASKREINSLIDSMSAIEAKWIGDERERRFSYKNILAAGDPAALIGMIKTLCQQKKELEAKGKHLHIVDERILRAAEQCLYDEWQYVLDMDRDDLISYIFSRIEKTP